MVTDEMIRVALLAFQSGDMDWSSQDEELMRFALEEALSAMPKPKPVAHLVWLQGRRAADDVEDYYEVARPGDKSVDGSDPFPVYATPPALEAALSAAEPVARQYRAESSEGATGWRTVDDDHYKHWQELELRHPGIVTFHYRDLYAAPPAPSVAVKALEWKRSGWVEAFSQPEGIGVWYSISSIKPVHGDGEPPFSCRVLWGVPNQTEGRYLGEGFQSVAEAKAAAQADYEARIRAALSAQVQDVAGWQSMDSAPHDTNVLLAWTDSTLPYGWKMEAGMASWGWRRDGVSNMSEHGQATHWMPLPAAPAKQEGGE